LLFNGGSSCAHRGFLVDRLDDEFLVIEGDVPDLTPGEADLRGQSTEAGHMKTSWLLPSHQVGPRTHKHQHNTIVSILVHCIFTGLVVSIRVHCIFTGQVVSILVHCIFTGLVVSILVHCIFTGLVLSILVHCIFTGLVLSILVHCIFTGLVVSILVHCQTYIQRVHH